MCRPRAPVLLLCLALGPALARAQTAAELRDRAARMTQALARAQALGARHDTLASRRQPVDSVRVGALRLIAAPSMVRTVRMAADTAWPAVARTFGRAADVLEHTPMVVQVAGQREGALQALPPAHEVYAPADAGAALIARGIVMQSAQIMGTREDTALQNWMLGTLIPRLAGGSRFDLVLEDVVTSSYTVVNQCYLGDRNACARALALTAAPDPIREWYDAPDRRQIVGAFNAWERARSAGAYRQCVHTDSDSACTAALRAMPSWLLTNAMAPLSGAARVAVIETAIDVGGPGAYDRLLATVRRPMRDRLAAAARMSVDSLLGIWRARVLAARPESLALGAKAAWAAVLWTVLLGFMALRSSRWR